MKTKTVTMIAFARAKGILDSSLADETKANVLSTVRKHAAALEGLQQRVACHFQPARARQGMQPEKARSELKRLIDCSSPCAARRRDAHLQTSSRAGGPPG